jgi:hypothetical protein
VAYVLAWNVITATGASMLGRRTDLTGRSTDIWPLVLKEADRHPILGSGYGGAWGLNGTLSTTLGLEQAHNGYLDVYLQLGIVGCVLLALFILEVCARIKRQYEYDRRWGVFGVAFLFMNLIYNLSESAFFDAYFGTGFVMASIVFSACNRTGIVGAPRNAPLGTRPVRGKDGVSDAAPVARERPREWSVKAPPPLHPRRPVTPTRGVRPPLRPAGAGRGSTRH